MTIERDDELSELKSVGREMAGRCAVLADQWRPNAGLEQAFGPPSKWIGDYEHSHWFERARYYLSKRFGKESTQVRDWDRIANGGLPGAADSNPYVPYLKLYRSALAQLRLLPAPSAAATAPAAKAKTPTAAGPSGLDVLVITALPLEFRMARAVLEALGVHLEEHDAGTPHPYWKGVLAERQERPIAVALARPTRMGPTATASTASALVERLAPRCLAMCGVCAGNPADVVLGDVVIAELAYAYDEGKRTKKGFEGDHRQIPLNESWLRKAQDFVPEGLPSHGQASRDDARAWLLRELYAERDLRSHPARGRYFPASAWGRATKSLERIGVIERDGPTFRITAKGRAEVEEAIARDGPPLKTLPYAVHAGPMASGNVVVKDGLTWDMLKKYGVRTVLALEMEAAAIAQVAYRTELQRWIVVKGVMDYADPKKDDRFKPFAARASAEVLLEFLGNAWPSAGAPAAGDPGEQSAKHPPAGSVNVIGDVSGSNIKIVQRNQGKVD